MNQTPNNPILKEQPLKKKLIIVDSHALTHRAYHALPPLTTKNGELINAVYGFLLVFLRALHEFQPDFVVATFDFPGKTFRHQKFKEYKATRPPVPDELYNQIPKIKEVLSAFNIPIFEKEGFEADDIIGTITRLASKKQIFPEIEIIILSGDLDTFQLVNPYTKVYFLKRGVKDIILYDEVMVKERYGLLSQQLVDFRALTGDPSDNIPGVPGVGEKTAIKLLKEFGSLENLYSALNQRPLHQIIGGGLISVNQRLRAKLEEYKEQAFFSKSLARINQNVEIDFKLEDCNWKDYDKEKAIEILKKLEFNSLIQRLP